MLGLCSEPHTRRLRGQDAPISTLLAERGVWNTHHSCIPGVSAQDVLGVDALMILCIKRAHLPDWVHHLRIFTNCA